MRPAGWIRSSAAGRFRASGGTARALPSAVQGDLAYNTNYWLSSLAVVNTPTPSGGVHIDQNGIPSIFSNTSMSNNFQDQPPEGAGTRAAVRLAPIFNVDMALTKAFRLPWEGKRLQFRAEAFNAFNHRELHQSESQPGIAADLRGISGDDGAALDAVRAAF